MGRGLEKSGSGLDKSGSDLARQNSSVSGISNVPAEEPEEEWETMSQLQQKITDQRLAFQEQQKQERAAAREARKAAAKKALRKKLRDPPPRPSLSTALRHAARARGVPAAPGAVLGAEACRHDGSPG
ncbi:unnamed protein product [Effrenium voratum]|nr:unnamed protein product [Effrenium voratum]